MSSTAFLMDTAVLVEELSHESRSERMEQRVKPTMKSAIEFAAALSGTDTSEFVSTAAFQAALARIASMRMTHLVGDDAKKFFAALDSRPEPNQALRDLMTDYDEGSIEHGV